MLAGMFPRKCWKYQLEIVYLCFENPLLLQACSGNLVSSRILCFYCLLDVEIIIGTTCRAILYRHCIALHIDDSNFILDFFLLPNLEVATGGDFSTNYGLVGKWIQHVIWVIFCGIFNSRA